MLKTQKIFFLGFSMLFPAAAGLGNSGNHGGDDHGYGGKCGYGQVQDSDENDNNNGHSDTVKTMQKQKHDNDCKEDEDDGEGDRGGGGGGSGGGGGGGGGDRAVVSTDLGSVVYVTAVTRHIRNPTPR